MTKLARDLKAVGWGNMVTAWVGFLGPARIRELIRIMSWYTSLTEREARVGMQWALDVGLVYLDREMLLRPYEG